MDDKVKNFIKENLDLIRENTKEAWEEIYQNIPSDIRGKFTETMLKANIDPAEIIKYIPKNYLYDSNISKYKIPNNVTRIRDRAFEKCDSLTSVIIGNSVTSIGFKAFEGCSSLTNVAIGNSVTTIYSQAFSRCKLLKSIVIPNSVTGIGSFVFSGSIEKATIPTIAISNVSNRSLKEVIITSGESIGYEAFKDCDSLTSVEISNSVTSIEDWAFFRCYSLTNIKIPNSVTSIGGWAFCYCRSLTSVTIPNSVTSIGSSAFEGCSSLTEIKYNGTKKQWRDISKDDTWKHEVNATIYCTDGVLEL